MKKVSIIIVTYNAENLIDECLSSVFKQRYKNFDVMVVDNNSSDNTVKLIRKKYPKTKIIQSKKNLGFMLANNLGFRKTKGDYVVLLNQDTVVEKNWLKELVLGIEKENVGACQPKIMQYHNKNKIDTTGSCVNYLGFGWCNEHGKLDYNIKERDIATASGACVILKRNIIERIGLLDNDFFMYHDDVDLGWRIRLAGYKITMAPKSVIYHRHSVESRESIFDKKIMGHKRIYYIERNRLITLMKNYSTKSLLLILPMLSLVELSFVAYSLTGHWFSERINIYRWFIGNMGKVLSKRKNVQKLRNVPDKEVVKQFTHMMKITGIKNTGMVDKFANPLLSIYWKIIKRII